MRSGPRDAIDRGEELLRDAISVFLVADDLARELADVGREHHVRRALGNERCELGRSRRRANLGGIDGVVLAKNRQLVAD